MTEPNALTPQPSDASSTASFTSPREVSLEALKAVLEQKDLPLISKIRLSIEHFRAIAVAHQEQVRAALAVSRAKTQADEHIAKGAIVLYETNAMYQLQSTFVKMMRELGVHVEMDRLSFMAEFGEQVTNFMDQLQKKQLREAFRQQIEGSAEDAFRRLCKRIDELSKSLVDQATDEKKTIPKL